MRTVEKHNGARRAQSRSGGGGVSARPSPPGGAHLQIHDAELRPQRLRYLPHARAVLRGALRAGGSQASAVLNDEVKLRHMPTRRRKTARGGRGTARLAPLKLAR